MGLDMYLNRYNLHGCTLHDAKLAEAYLDLQDHLANPENTRYTLKEWCGKDESELNQDALTKITPEFIDRCLYWDDKKSYAYKRISENVGYWRKANHIHNWFVENVQNGNDDCNEYIVSREQLEALKTICEKVLASIELADGMIPNGAIFKDGKMIPNMEPGQYIVDASTCEELLPTVEGFFFGATNYDEYYVHDVRTTLRILTDVLNTTNFDTQTITYVASW